jgi:hypothetical protein
VTRSRRDNSLVAGTISRVLVLTTLYVKHFFCSSLCGRWAFTLLKSTTGPHFLSSSLVLRLSLALLPSTNQKIAPRPMAGKPTLPDSGRSQPSSQCHADAASPLPSRSRSTGFSVRWLCLPGSSHTATCSPPPLKIYSMWIPIHYQWLCSQAQQQQAREDGGCHDPPGSERRMRDVCSALTALSTTARPHLSYPSVQSSLRLDLTSYPPRSSSVSR